MTMRPRDYNADSPLGVRPPSSARNVARDLSPTTPAAESPSSKGTSPHFVLYSKSSKPRGRAVKNWFDSDEDIEDAKSLHSSESTLAGKDDDLELNRSSTHNLSSHELNNLGRSYSRSGMIKAEVSAGTDNRPVWGNDITITRQVIVETSSR